MNVKGIAFLAREATMISAHGEAAWRKFLAEFAEKEPVFREKILPVTRIPANAFLALNDALTDTFYGGDKQAYWLYGEKSGEFALSAGQLKGLFAKGQTEEFLMFTPRVWRGYYDESKLEVAVASPATIDVHIFEVPVKHVYFEYTANGFISGGMRLLGAAHPTPERLRGFSKGDADILYRYQVK